MLHIEQILYIHVVIPEIQRGQTKCIPGAFATLPRKPAER